MSYYGSFMLQCYVLRMRVTTSTVGGNLTNRPPALRHIHVNCSHSLIFLLYGQNCSCASHSGMWSWGGKYSFVLNLNSMWGWVTRFTHRPFYPQRVFATHWSGMWVELRGGTDALKKNRISCCSRECNRDSPNVQPLSLCEHVYCSQR